MDYRDEVKRTANVDVLDPLLMGILGLVGEAGELADLLKKEYFQGAPPDRVKFMKELGDVRWYFEVICMALDTDIEEIQDMNVAKLRARYPNGFTVAASNVRKEGDT